MSRVVVVVITADGILQRCFQSVLQQRQDLPHLRLIANHRSPERFSSEALIQKYENCHRNRNEARERALQTDGDFFLFLDDDIVLPRGAVSTLLSQKKPVVAGYYQILGTGKYVCGRWVADNTFYSYEQVQPGLVKTDVVGLGCALISRRVLEKVRFEAGVDVFCKDARSGQAMLVGECGMFGNRVAELGIPMYMCGDVVCEHLVRPPLEMNTERVLSNKSHEFATANCQPATGNSKLITHN